MRVGAWSGLFILLVATQVAAFDIRFDGHAVLSCELKDEAMAHEIHREANNQELDVWSHSTKVGKKLQVQVPSERREFWEKKYGCQPFIEDVQEIIDQQFSHAAMIRGLQGVEALVGEGEGSQDWYSQYHRFGEIVRRTKELAENHPDIAEFVPSIGKSVEGRHIPVIHITGPPLGQKGPGGQKAKSSAKNTGKPQIWMNGGQHAREWIAPAAVMYMTEHLLKGYKSKDPKIKHLLDKFEFVVAPVINPDGYEYSHTGNRLWRKNRRKNADGTYGVDLNRNWDNHWGEGGASTRPSATDYQGPHVASEPEVRACQNYILKEMKHRVAGIDFHSYGDMILRSKGWTSKASRDESMLRKMGADMRASIKHAKKGEHSVYKSEMAAGLYPTTGSTDDWMSEQGKMWGHGWTVELPDSDKGGHGFLLPASQILPASTEVHKGLLSFLGDISKEHDKRERMGAEEWRKEIAEESMALAAKELDETDLTAHLAALSAELEAHELA